MKRSVVLVLAVAAAIVASQVRAQDTYTTYGSGNSSCGEWLQSSAAGLTHEMRRTLLLSWVLGFVSGVGYSGVHHLKATDGSGVEVWIDRYCETRPLDTLARAAAALTRELRVD